MTTEWFSDETLYGNKQRWIRMVEGYILRADFCEAAL